MKIKGLNRTVVIISALFSFFYYGLGCMVNYKPDIYWAIGNPRRMLSAMLYSDGRWMNALIYRIFRHEGQPFYVFYYISFVISLILITAAVSVFGHVLTEHIQSDNHIFITLLSCLTVANMFSAEYFLYTDQMIAYTLSVLLSVIAVKSFTDYLKGTGRIKDLICPFICLFLCVYMAEVIASVFVILTVPFILIYSDSFKKFVRNQVVAGMLYGISMLSKLVFTRFIVRSDRAENGESGVASTVAQFIPQGRTPQAYILDRITFGMWIYIAICLILAILLTVMAVKRKTRFDIIKGLYITIVTVILGTLPYVFRFTGNIVPRVYYPLGTLIGVLSIYGLMSGLLDLEADKLKITIISLTVVLAGAQWLSFVQIFTDQYITNYDDKMISEIIGEKIDEYEKESGNKIEYVVFYSDSIRTKYARTEGWCLSQRAFDASWSKLETLNYYLGTNYKPGVSDENLAKQYIDENWNVFSDDQIKFDGNTAHICTY